MKILLTTKKNNFYISASNANNLRYGENLIRKLVFIRQLKIKLFFEKLNGKELSYNNLNDLRLGLKLVAEFSSPTCVIIKHAI